MTYDFDELIDRRNSDSTKWSRYGDALPLWVADMDFRSPAPILEAIRERVAHGVFGYSVDLPELKEAVCTRMQQRYNWQVAPDEVVFLPGLVCGINVVVRAIGERGDGMLAQTPVYFPFLTAPGNQRHELHTVELTRCEQNGHLRYEIDMDRFEAAIRPNTRLFMLCNPHNPVGRTYTVHEQMAMAEAALRHDLTICSDEIHSDLLLDGAEHIPMASLAPEIAQRTITLIAPSKTFNIPSLGCSMAIIQNPALRKRFDAASAGIVPHVNVLGLHAALAAYTECEEWLRELLAYLTANRNFVMDYVRDRLPGVSVTAPEATYLAWLDCREADLGGSPHDFFLREAGVAFNDGAVFGPGGEGFVRLNFGCPRATLTEALDRMRAALTRTAA